VGTILDELQNLSYDFFLFQLDWLLAFNKRHADARFCIIGICVVNVEELYQEVGRAPASDMVSEFTRRLKEQIRDTDFSTRNGLYELWILFPRMHRNDKDTIIERLKQTVTVHPGSPRLECSVVGCAVPDELINENEQGTQLMARLQMEMEHVIDTIRNTDDHD
jgi:GGDEF domain-containing protein